MQDPALNPELMKQQSYSQLGTSLLDVNQYRFVSHAYNGDGGFKDGSYLLSYSSESKNYLRRKQEVSYKNYLKGIVDSLITPVFSSQAVRVTDNDMFEAFMTDVTNGGVGIQEFTKSAVRACRLHGIVFVVMDNFSDTPTSRQEAINNRMYPYTYLKYAYDYHSADVDQYGKIISITFYNGLVTVGDRPVETTITFNNYNTEVKQLDGKVIGTYPHEAGIVPVFAMKLDAMGSLQPTPPVYSLAALSYVIFQQDSEQRNTERQSAFNMLTIPSLDSNAQVSVGNDSILYYDPNSSQAPSYIGPDSGVLDVLMRTEAQNVADLLASADNIGATAVQTSSPESGVAKAYKFIGQSFALEETAELAEKCEMVMAKMFSLFIGEPVSYAVEYDDNYSPTFSETQQKLAFLKELLAIPNMPTEVLTDIQNSIVSLYKLNFPNNQIGIDSPEEGM